MSSRSEFELEQYGLVTEPEIAGSERENDGTIGGFYAALEKIEVAPVPERDLDYVFEIAERPEDGVQPLVLDGELTTIKLAGGPTKSIGGDNLHELMDHLNRDGESWFATTLKIAFPDALTDLPDVLKAKVEDPDGLGKIAFQTFDADQRSNAIHALNQWAEVSGLHFVLAGPGEQANIYFMNREYDNKPTLLGQSSGVDEINGSLIRMNMDHDAWGPFNPGSASFVTLMHEIGHSLGLDHPGNYGYGDNAEYDTHAEYIQDSDQYTIMSYFETTDTGASAASGHIYTPRTHDMWVTQKLYGADWFTRTNSTTYGYNPTPDVQGSHFDFQQGIYGPHMTIWDAGGSDDTLDLSLSFEQVVLNLNPGSFSSTHGEVMNLSIAYGPDEATPAGKNFYIEHAIGGIANDLLVGNAVDNELNGGNGNDTLLGGHGDDTLLGSWGDDQIWGGFGLDFFDGGGGFDVVHFTHSDVDWEFSLYSGTASNAFGTEELHNVEGIVGSNGDDSIVGDGEDNFLDGRDGNDTIEGMMGDDTLKGGDGADQMSGGMGSNELDGGDGTDTLFYMFSSGAWDVDMMTGVASNQYGDVDTFENFEAVVGGNDGDTILGDTANNIILGFDGDDDLHGRAGVDLLNGQDGNDTLTGGPGDDIMVGGDGSDTARYLFAQSAVTVDLEKVAAQNTYGSGWDTVQEVENVIGSSWDDFLLGDDVANRLEGKSGDDQLFGRLGNDVLKGDFGDDILEGGLGDDFLFGGEGQDAASYFFSTQGVYVWLGAVGPYNTVTAGMDLYDSIEDIVGSFFADALYGDDGNNRIYAGAGNDVLVGNAGIDDLFGGDGNDILIGGASHDFMDGGEGIDWARYDGAGDVTVDLSDTTEQWTGAGTDKLVNIENLRGWMGDDELFGDDGDNEIVGLSGDDTLYGGAGVDTLSGGNGNDKIYVGMDKPTDLTDDLQDLQTNGGGDGELPSGRFDLSDDWVVQFTGLVDDEVIVTNAPIAVKTVGLGATARSGDGYLLPGTGDGGGGTIEPIGGEKIPPVGSGPDVILFAGNWGDDEVFDFYPGGDKLDFSGVSGVDEVADLTIGDTNDGVLIEYGENSVLLHDVEQVDLNDSDFWF